MKYPKLKSLAAALSLASGAHAAFAADVNADRINGVYPSVEAVYKDLHSHPELGFEVERTEKTLADLVKPLGFEVTTGIAGHGLVAILHNGPGPTVMLRTELDALPVQEKTDLPFASKATAKTRNGDMTPVAHACGHDIHMSSWYGTARIMAENRSQWSGTLMLVGQPAEELVAGAAAMVKDGLFTRFKKPDYALSMHDEGTLASGVVGYHPGYFRASSDAVEITLFGQGGHGAAPQETIDPVVMAAKTVMALQTIISRENNPVDPAVITVGSIHGGTAGNVVPDQVKLQLTVRTFSEAVRNKVHSAIVRIVKGEAQASNAQKEPIVDIKRGTDAVFNDPALTERMANAVRGAVGKDKVAALVEMPAKMTSEDFSVYGQNGVKAVLLHVGAVPGEKLEAAKKRGIPLPGTHSPQWAPEYEPTLKATIAAETAILFDLMAKPQ
jgi:amidohydrolase